MPDGSEDPLVPLREALSSARRTLEQAMRGDDVIARHRAQRTVRLLAQRLADRVERFGWRPLEVRTDRWGEW
jgi:hypothetical protein